MLREKKGITLIALVITIIVLLILAGVTIATLTGDNGILTKATEAKEQNEIGKEKEEISVAYSGALTEKEGKGPVTAGDLNSQFNTNGTNATADGESPITVTFTDTGNSYTVDSTGKIDGPEKSNIIASLKIVGEKATGEPPLPSADFTHTEGEVDTGYVIQDKSGNEFVWVPVDKNQKIQINVTSKEEIGSLVLTDPYGDDILTLSGVGTSYNNTEIEPTINGIYRLTVTAGEETKKVFLNVHSLYAIDTMADWFFTEEYAKLEGASSLEEYLGEYTLEEAYEISYEIYGSDLKDFTEPEDDYADTVESVKANGGFYIGRYEASYENGNVASKVSTVLNNYDDTLKNGKLWNYISQADALEKTKNMYPNAKFTSSLLTGAAWDRTLGWLEETGAVSAVEIVGDSKNWGNYSNDEFSNTENLINTGSMLQTMANNIYDLAGNLDEWTTEVDDTGGRVMRGRRLRRS